MEFNLTKEIIAVIRRWHSSELSYSGAVSALKQLETTVNTKFNMGVTINPQVFLPGSHAPDDGTEEDYDDDEDYDSYEEESDSYC